MQKTGALNRCFYQQHLPASDLERYAYEPLAYFLQNDDVDLFARQIDSNTYL
jgi:hypothetical protein